MKNVFLSFVLAATAILLISCGDDDGPASVDPIDAKIASFSITSPVEADGEISGKNVSVSVPAGTDVTAMSVKIVIPVGATVSPASGSTLDFTNPVTFKVSGNDKSGVKLSEDFVVTVNQLAPNKIGFMSVSGSAEDVKETDEAAALAWFQNEYKAELKFISFKGLASTDLVDVKVLYFYWDYTGTELASQVASFKADGAVLKTWVDNGGKLVLAGHATNFLVNLEEVSSGAAPGIIGTAAASAATPRLSNDVWSIVGDQDALGRAAKEFGYKGSTDWDRTDHPLFSNLSTIKLDVDSVGYDYPTYPLNNAYTREDHNAMWDMNNGDFQSAINWAAGADDNNWTRAEYIEQTWNGYILGQWGQVSDMCCLAIFEFLPDSKTDGTVIAIGTASYDWDTTEDVLADDPGEGNDYQSNIENMTKNAISYLSGLADGKANYSK